MASTTAMLLLRLSCSAAGPARGPYPRTSLWDGEYLAATRRSPHLASAVAAVVASAERRLPLGPFSVLNKTEVAASGDKHDFYCGATYFWPCNVNCEESVNYQGEPFNCSDWANVPNDMGLADSWPGPCDLNTGLPWTSHDLYANSYWRSMDRDTFDSLCFALFPLVLSWFHTGNTVHGERAATLLRVYFLNAETAMNATTGLHWAAAEPGRYPNGVNGPSDRGGVVEFNRFARILDLVAILEWGDETQSIFTPSDRAQMRDWTERFMGWWVLSADGQQSVTVQNNIGTGYTINALAMAMFLEDGPTQDVIIEGQARQRFESQVAPDGHLPMEDTNDADSFGYHAADVIEFQDLAFMINRSTGTSGIDMYTFVVPNSTANSSYGGGGSLQKLAEFLVPTCQNFSNWSGTPLVVLRIYLLILLVDCFIN